jgi:hypothetical protein
MAACINHADESILLNPIFFAMMIRKIYALFVVPAILTLLPNRGLHAQAIALHPENPHYFLYHGKANVLITSGEHYGAVLNPDFDYITYLDELASKGLNLTRTFSGSYAELGGTFQISHNTLAPAPGKLLSPWARSSEPGYRNGGNKFDLQKWDDRYFRRLKAFISAAQQRNIIVEFTFFCPFYEDTLWTLSPMNSLNNINGLKRLSRNDVYTLHKNGSLLQYQEKMVSKIVQELKDFGNVMYEICNEPYFGGVELAWQRHIAGIIRDAEKDFSARHLITQNIANGNSKIEDPIPAVSVFNFHYAWPPVTVALNYHLQKVIGDNETGFRGNSDSTYRMEGWRFILAGGGLFNNLDYSFTAGHEKGDYAYPPTQPGGGSAALRNQLGWLKRFMESFDFINMRPDSTTVTGGLPGNAVAQTLSETGKQYAIYIYGGRRVDLELELPRGNYTAEWLNTLTGQYSGKRSLKHAGGKAVLSSPEYSEDIALRIVKANR